MKPTPAPLRERRKGDRRRAARADAPAQAESWFGAVGVTDSATALGAEAPTQPADSHFEAGWPGTAGAGPDSRFLSRQARRIVGSGANAFERIYAAFIGARVAVGVALLVAQVAASGFGSRPPLALELICALYAVQVLALWAVERARARPGRAPMTRLGARQWLDTVGTDVVAFSLLHLFGASSGLNYFPLLGLPVLMAGVLTPRRIALGTTASITLILLAAAALSGLAGADPVPALAQAGLAGIGFFVITLLAGELAGRLAREELTARGSLELARQQAQLNRLVIEEMQDGVMVVDRRGRVRAANPAARALLATGGDLPSAPFPLSAEPAWAPLMVAIERAFVEGSWPEAGRDVRLDFGAGRARTLRLRVRFTRRREERSSEEVCVLFVEDVRRMQARTRQEKLAAMGRVSAGIAHEIRNPLAAIAQANALLAEDVQDPAQRQLAGIVRENVERLKRIVDDVMEVAPGTPPFAGAIDASAVAANVCSEWARTAELPVGAASPLALELPREPLPVRFDAEHLRRVLVNLLDNALRHGGRAPGAIAVALTARDERECVLSVASAGKPIEPEVEPYLFEPFFSTRSRGTGLGLYICRELCQRYGGNIDYRQRPMPGGAAPRNEFVVTMQRASASPSTPPAESRSLFA